MRVRIEATLPSNHACNDTWILQNELKKLGLTDVSVYKFSECEVKPGRSCKQCNKCVRTDDVATKTVTYHCTDRRNDKQMVLSPETACCDFFSYKPNIDEEEASVGPMHKVRDRWIPD